MAPIGKRIRDLERSLKRCSPDQVAKLNLSLEKLLEERKNNQKKLKEKVNSQKYHLIRFVERQKLCRKIHSTISKLNDNNLKSSERKKFSDMKDKLENDLTYVLYFPMMMKYIALFANKNETADENENIKKLQDRAREQAQLSRKRDIELGYDKVKNAIEVELGIKQKNSIDSKKRKFSQDENDSESPDEMDNTIHDKLDDSSIKNKLIVKNKKSKPAKSSSDLLPLNEDLFRANSSENDPFFVEEDSNPTGKVSQQFELEPQSINKSFMGSYKNSSRNYSKKSFGKKFNEFKNPKEMTKQELRLMKWQEKRRLGDGRGK